MKKKKRIKLVILPEDFNNNTFSNIDDCPLARAIKRHFNTNDVSVGVYTVDVGFRGFDIKDGFSFEDYEFVKEIKEPYPITLIED